MQKVDPIRAANMAAIKSKGNKTTELTLITIFKKEKITGWRRGQKIMGSRPDFVFYKTKLAVFADGCFWHGCPHCYQIPKTNRQFWENKIRLNKLRDKKIDRKYIENGWNTLHIWEHQLKKNEGFVIKKLKKNL